MPTLKQYDYAAFLLFALATLVYGYNYFYGSLSSLQFHGYLVFGLVYAGIRLYRLTITEPALTAGTQQTDE